MKTQRADCRTNDSGTQFVVRVFLNRLTDNYESSETANILREIADKLDNADFTVSRATHVLI